MHRDEWNKQDEFTLELYSPANLLDRGREGVDAVLDFIESIDAELRPQTIYLSRKRKYSRQLVHEQLDECRVGANISFILGRSQPVDESLLIDLIEPGNEDTRFALDLTLRPFASVRETGRTEEHTHRLLSLVRTFAQRFPISYGLAHSRTDFYLSSDPHRTNPFSPKRVYEAYWLNVYGPQLVEELGRQRLLSTPAAHMEELPGGAVLWLTRPTPADFDSEEARLAQARALVHLRPELKLEETLSTLRQRSLAFTPLPVQFDEDVADILWRKVEHEGLMTQRENVERFNAYHPPPVSEWLPAAQAPTPDVADVQQAIDLYEGQYAEQLIALLAKKVPAVLDGTVDALPQVDYHLWHKGWARRLPDEEKEILGAALGAWLGMFLVHTLGGRWVPRRALDEAAVVVGDRAWLPFLRARHSLQGREAPLDFSCTQLFRLAQRLARAPSR
ncbi:hypothetical protein [Archangium sp.]|uniref:hypothetical protein n=1 Tax=Archangium sp. TaxID=1872627 RepID=UPI003899EEEC